MTIKPLKRFEECSYLAQYGFKERWCELYAHSNSTNMVERECAVCQLPNAFRPEGIPL